ncbi:Scr1 family TA system antitoxin-like transcriptional regulator [Streptomyces sp. NPDC002701]|uniref:DUF397 domain-containing protein n=1 Tax=Streptomyces sp. NPDC002701 TaxID=3364661 RepID=UPI00368B5083
MRLEATARVMHKLTLGVPGLLQTEEFAREVLSGAQATPGNSEIVEEQVAARMGRQLLLRRTPAPNVRFIVDEYAFRRPAGTAKNWDDQLLRIEAAAWRKSSYSDGGDNNCVEVAAGFPGIVPVRDSKTPQGPVLVFSADPWALFVRSVSP